MDALTHFIINEHICLDLLMLDQSCDRVIDDLGSAAVTFTVIIISADPNPSDLSVH